jgi:hypothetical protein
MRCIGRSRSHGGCCGAWCPLKIHVVSASKDAQAEKPFDVQRLCWTCVRRVDGLCGTVSVNKSVFRLSKIFGSYMLRGAFLLILSLFRQGPYKVGLLWAPPARVYVTCPARFIQALGCGPRPKSGWCPRGPSARAPPAPTHGPAAARSPSRSSPPSRCRHTRRCRPRRSA